MTRLEIRMIPTKVQFSARRNFPTLPTSCFELPLKRYQEFDPEVSCESESCGSGGALFD